jgi:hypothetical protein
MARPFLLLGDKRPEQQSDIRARNGKWLIRREKRYQGG